MSLPKIVPFDLAKTLHLTNNGELSLFWIGTGSAFSKQLFQTNMLIMKGNDHLLVDCSSRCPFALSVYGNSITNIKNIFITHSHADHIGGLEETALMGRYVAKEKPKIIITEEYQKILWEQSLKGGCAYNEKPNGKPLKFTDLFEPIRPKKIKEKPIQILETNIGGLNIKIFRTNHIPDNAKSWKNAFISYGMLIDDRILYTCDTKYDPDLIHYFIENYNSIEFIFHDAQLFDGGVHASYKELLEFSDKIRNKMYLVHYGDNYDQFKPENDGFLGFTKQGHFYIFD